MFKDIKSGIYKICNLVNGKIYIGSSINLFKRQKEHFRCLKSNKHNSQHLQNSWNTHGEENFVFEIIEEIKEKEKLIEREQYYLDILNPEYNICPTAGSQLGTKRTNEQKEKMSKSHIGIQSGENHPMFGKKRTDLIDNPIGAKLKREDVEKIRKEYFLEKNELTEIYKKYSFVNKKTLRNVINYDTWVEEKPSSYKKRKRKCNNPKLTLEKVREIRAMYKTGNYTQKQLEEIFTIDQTQISNIVRNKQWIE